MNFVYNGRKERRCGWDEEMGGASARVSAFARRDGEDCGFIVASVEAEDNVSTVEALKQTLGLTTLPMGTGGLDAFLSYEQPGIPFSVLIDADGTVRAMHLGVATAEGRLDALDDIR